MVIDNNKGGEYGKYFVQDLQEPANMGTPEFKALYKQFAKRIIWMDSNVCEGAFQMNTAWYFAAAPRDPIFLEHVHDYDELIGFYGSDPDDPYELGGVIEFSMNDEAHRLTRSTMIWCPAGVRPQPHADSRGQQADIPFLCRDESVVRREGHLQIASRGGGSRPPFDPGTPRCREPDRGETA